MIVFIDCANLAVHYRNTEQDKEETLRRNKKKLIKYLQNRFCKWQDSL